MTQGVSVLRVLFLWIGLLFGATVATAQSIVTDLSQNDVAITANFDGSQIFIFGAVKSAIMPDVNAAPLDVIIEVAGPSAPVEVRKKVHKFGIWVNGPAVEITQAPVFYSLAGTRPVREILSDEERAKYNIGLDYVVQASDDIAPEYKDALIRIRQERGTFAKLESPVKLSEQTLFTTKVNLPSNLVEGDYTASIYLVRDQAVVASSVSEITVRKAGMERWIYNLAHEKPLIYGLLSLLVALVAGYGASTIFRLMKR